MVAATIVGVVAGVVAVVFAYLSWRQVVVTKSARDMFVRTSEYLRDHYAAVAEASLEVNRAYRIRGDLKLLGRPDWLLPDPIPLADVGLILKPADPGLASAGNLSRWERGWPDRADGSAVRRYSDAIKESKDRPGLFWDSDVYRLLDVDTADGLRLTYTVGRYFDAMDTQEVLAYHTAQRIVRSKSPAWAYRRLEGGPLQLTNRCASTATVTLTIIKTDDGPHFLMHLRDPAKVALAANTYHMTPVGEFEPSDVWLGSRADDFSLWNNVMREYAEEFLDMNEYCGEEGTRCDYVEDSPFKELNEALGTGSLMAWCVGIGLVPASWKAEILTVVVFDGACFESVLGQWTRVDSEGRKLGYWNGVTDPGLKFDAETIQMFLDHANIHPTAYSLLVRAWECRDQLLA